MTNKHLSTSGHPLDVCKCGALRCDHEQTPAKRARNKKNELDPCKKFSLARFGGRRPEPIHV